MNSINIKNDEARPEMDALLRDFFQAEMPQAWPNLNTPAQVQLKEPASFCSRSSGRLALAACIALLVGGYLSLGGFFPRAQTPMGLEQSAPDVAKGFEKLKKDLPKVQNNQDEPMATPMGTINR